MIHDLRAWFRHESGTRTESALRSFNHGCRDRMIPLYVWPTWGHWRMVISEGVFGVFRRRIKPDVFVRNRWGVRILGFEIGFRGGNRGQ